MNDDDQNYSQRNDTATAIAMLRAREAEQHAASLRAEAQAAEAKQRQQRADIAAAVELSVANNPQLLAQRMGVTTSRVVSSAEVGYVAGPEIIRGTPIKVFGGIEVGGQQAIDMVTNGQLSQAEYNTALSAALAVRGFKAPPSFQKAR